VTTCRACDRRDAAAPSGRPTEPGDPPVRPVDAGAALILRVWRDDGLRARLLAVDPPQRTVATAQGVDEICDAVRAWLSNL